jgi:hypothetical protein
MHCGRRTQRTVGRVCSGARQCSTEMATCLGSCTPHQPPLFVQQRLISRQVAGTHAPRQRCSWDPPGMCVLCADIISISS